MASRRSCRLTTRKWSREIIRNRTLFSSRATHWWCREDAMRNRTRIWTVAVVACALSGAWAQDTTPPDESSSQSTPQQPVPAYGQDNSAVPVSKNPPISGLDLPSLEPHTAPLSYLQPGATFSEAADSNAASALGGTQHFTSLTHALGSLELRRVGKECRSRWSPYH